MNEKDIIAAYRGKPSSFAVTPKILLVHPCQRMTARIEKPCCRFYGLHRRESKRLWEERPNSSGAASPRYPAGVAFASSFPNIFTA